MSLSRRILILLLGSLLASIFSDAFAQKYHLPFVRLDSVLYHQIQKKDSLSLSGRLSPDLSPYGRAVGLLAGRVLNLDDQVDSLGLQQAIVARYSHPGFKTLYADVEQAFAGSLLSEVHRQIEGAFARLGKCRPSMLLPDTLYTHVSGLSQRIVVAPGLLSISLDYYLGASYPIYVRFFTPWQRQLSSPDLMAFDAVLGWLISEMPEPREQAITLDDKLRYWGEIYRWMRKAFSRSSEQELFGFSKEQHQWLCKNYKHLIRNARERAEFASPSPIVIDKYFSELPQGSSLPPEAPRLIGPWIGYRLYGR